MPNTDNLTPKICAESVNQSTILIKEKERYEWKGYGLFFCIVQVALFFLYWPTIMEKVWPHALKFMEDYNMSREEFYICFGVF